MNDHVNYRQFLYGREEQAGYLHSILKRTFACRNAAYDVVDRYQPHWTQQQENEWCRDISAGTVTTAATDCTCDTKFSGDDRRASIQTHDGRRCQFVLVQGPVGSAKHSFIRGTINQIRRIVNSKIQGSDRSILKHSLSEDENEGQSQSSPFLIVEGRFRHYEASATNKRNNLQGKGIPLIPFDDAMEEMFYIIQNDLQILEAIRTQFVSMIDNPVDDFHVLCETYPFMKSWLHKNTSTTAVSSEKFDGNCTTGSQTSLLERRSKIVIATRATLRQEYFILHEARLRSPLITKFFIAVSNCIPVVLVLRDMHYADAESIALLENLLQKINLIKESRGLLVVATCQVDDNINKSISFQSFFDRCQATCHYTNSDIMADVPVQVRDIPETSSFHQGKAIIPFHHVIIEDYTSEQVLELVHDCCGSIETCSDDQKYELAGFIFQKAKGKPFYVSCILRYIELVVDVPIDVIRKNWLPNGINSILDTILLQQDSSIQTLLKTAAALAQFHGSIVYLKVIDMLLGSAGIDAVRLAEQSGFIECSTSGRCIEFSDFAIQTASYNLIPLLDRPAYHVDIGRRIWQNLVQSISTNVEAYDYEILNQMLLAVTQLQDYVDLLTNSDECYLLSKSCYEAGTISCSCGDYDGAAKMYDFAIRVLGIRVWQGELYETSLVLHNSLAQAYCCLGEDAHFEKVENAICDNARTFYERIPATITLIYSHASRNKMLSACTAALDALKELGVSINQNPSSLSIIVNFLRIKRVLQRMSINELKNFPNSKNERDITIALLLSHASIYSFMVKAEIGISIVFRMLHLSIDKGISGPSAVAFALFGVVLCATGQFEEGHRMSQVALTLVDRFKDWIPRVYGIVYGNMNNWTHSFRDSLIPLHRSLQIALKCGDVETFAASSAHYVLTLLISGSKLVTLTPIARSLCESLITFGQTNPLLLALPMWRVITDLQCTSNDLIVKHSAVTFSDNDGALKYAIKENVTYSLGHIYMMQAMWCYLIGDYEDAINAARNSCKHRPLLDYTTTFYEGLAVLAAVRTMKSFTLRHRYRKRGKRMRNRMRQFAKRCPANFLNKQYLLEAEMAALNGKIKHAIQLYHQSIEKSNKEGILHEEGIAYERLGQFQRFLGDENEAKANFRRARMTYEKWGASRLVQRIDELVTNTGIVELTNNNINSIQ